MKYQKIESVPSSSNLAKHGDYPIVGKDDAALWHFRMVKRIFDILGSIFLVPVLLLACLALLMLNPFLNRGTLFFVQTRMGKGTRPFRAIKFRSMRHIEVVERGAHDPLEMDRITPLGHFLRKSRIDELPQIVNVITGEMSLIGPRPDYIAHAEEFVATVPGYRARHAVRPGISGYAQTEVGYAENLDALTAKVAADLFYIRNCGYRFEAWIVWRTLQTILGRRGV